MNKSYDGRYEWVGPTVLISKEEPQYKEFREVQKDTGVSPDELWNLDRSISVFLVPRLKMYKDNSTTHPISVNGLKEWHEILDKMIYAFETLSNDDIETDDESVNAKVEEGLDLFRKYIRNLWD